MNETHSEEAVKDALARARAHSPFLKLQLDRFPDVAQRLEAGRAEDAMARAASAGANAGNLGAALRRERSALAAALAVADLAGAIPLERLMEALADLADRALGRALAAAFAERTPDDAPSASPSSRSASTAAASSITPPTSTCSFSTIRRPCR
jgi:glutamate-ammonia-ligase adenylyltransferase